MAPCTACSWTAKRQAACRYNSHVKLFYSTSDRGAWSLGPKYIFKERPNSPPSFEARNLRFLKEKTTIPVPAFVLDYAHQDRYFIQTERVPGDTLDAVWKSLSAAEKECIAKQTAEYLLQLRGLQAPRMQSLGDEPLFSAFLFMGAFGQPYGPLSSDEDLWAAWAPILKDIPEKARLRLRERMPLAGPYTFTHGDLFMGNIVVEGGELAGILDWEWSGYYPVWWEFACAGIGLGEEDAEWKGLLRKYLVPHHEGRAFWRDLWALRGYPEIDEQGVEVLARLCA